MGLVRHRTPLGLVIVAIGSDKCPVQGTPASDLFDDCRRHQTEIAKKRLSINAGSLQIDETFKQRCGCCFSKERQDRAVLRCNQFLGYTIQGSNVRNVRLMNAATEHCTDADQPGAPALI
jgi:hypothetical protein